MSRRLPGAPSRRELLTGGAAAVGAAVLAGCSSKARPPSNVPLTPRTPGARRDAQILNGLLQLEYEAIAAYTAAIPLLLKIALREHAVPPPPAPGVLPPPPPPPPPGPLKLVPPLAVTAAQNFLGLELAHVGELEGFIRQAGGTPVAGRAFYDLGHPTDRREMLLLLHRVEAKQLKAYREATLTLTTPRLRAAMSAILANEAQQVTILRLELGLTPVPSAFIREAE